MKAEPHGSLIWFDPEREAVKLYRLPPSTSEDDLGPRSLEGLDQVGETGELDRVVSMSGADGADGAEQTRFIQGGLFKEEDPLPF